MYRFWKENYLVLKSKIEMFIKGYETRIYILSNIKLNTKKDGSEYQNLKQAFNIKELENLAKEKGLKWFSLEKDEDKDIKIDYYFKDSDRSSVIYLAGETRAEILKNIKEQINNNVNYLKREELRLKQLEKLKDITKLFIDKLNETCKNDIAYSQVSFTIREIACLINEY